MRSTSRHFSPSSSPQCWLDSLAGTLKTVSLPVEERRSGDRLEYRRDIDGLRAVAVLPVIMFHANLPFVGGGYVGVDVFFVISGYLITSIILQDIERGRFSIANFYERRARRILPALVTVTLATLIAAWFLLYPDELVRLARSTISAMLFVSNAYFWHSLDYFAPAAEYEPLLHSWSLAVEEQFYIVYPILLLILCRFSGRRAALWAIVGISVLSLAASIGMLDRWARAVFFLSPFRAWELGAGAMLALAAPRVVMSRRGRDIVAAIGLLAIVAPVFLYHADTPFPGLAALPPVLGTAILIWIGTDGPNIVSRLLALRPMVAVGLLSYSLYLWHWPVLALLRARLGHIGIPRSLALAAMILVFFLAWLSYRYIEQPIRKKPRWIASRRLVFVTSGGALAIVVLLSGLVLANHGFPSRYSSEVRTALAGSHDVNPMRDKCVRRSPEQGLCSTGSSESSRKDNEVFLLWGDSHADMIVPAIVKAADNFDRRGFWATYPACPPLIGVDVPTRPECSRYAASVVNFLDQHPEVVKVIIAARWFQYSIPIDRNLNAPPIVRAAGQEKTDSAIFREAVLATVSKISRNDRQIIVVGSVPEPGWDVPIKLANNLYWGTALPPLQSREKAQRRTSIADAVFRDLEAQGAIDYLEVIPHWCGGVCPVEDHGKPLFRDDDHVSRTGAMTMIYPLLTRIWEEKGAR